MALNKKHSFKDYTHLSHVETDSEEWDHSTIRGTCFYQEAKLGVADRSEIEKHIFPEDMQGVIFENCNLDNVYVSSLNVVLPSCSHRLIKVQNDREDWELDKASLKPVEPINKEGFEQLGLSTDPKDISIELKTESITQEKERLDAQEIISGP